MDIETVRRVCLARHLYQLGKSSLKSENDLNLFSASNLLQDAVEAFLLAVAGFFNVDIEPNTNFNRYFTLINKKTSKTLPFKDKLLQLNKIRVNSKHYGILPARGECIKLSIVVKEFFEEVSNSFLKVNFSTVSSIDLLEECDVKDLLCSAKSALEQGDFKKCSIFCRKAIFVEFETKYDISVFKEDIKQPSLLSAYCQAPFFAKNKDYIEKNVGNLTDYIVYDHSTIDQELLKYGIDNTAF
jgi:hypothetical protein